MSMNEITPGLWLGDMPSALNRAALQANNIASVLSVMRGKITVHETFSRRQIELDDTEDADVLQHFLPCIEFIQSALDRGRGGVLVHCMAGMSRSASIVAAYIMYIQQIDAISALDIIRAARSCVQPNDGFMFQLEVFKAAAYKVSKHDKTTRLFYMERAVKEAMSGDGSMPATDNFAKFPHTPSISGTPAITARRRIRCKMCRQELAVREHMIHGVNAQTPVGGVSPAGSRRPSQHAIPETPASRRGSSAVGPPRSHLGPTPVSSRSLLLGFDETSVNQESSEILSMSALEIEDEDPAPSKTLNPPSPDDLVNQLKPKLSSLLHPLSPPAPSPPILYNHKCSGYFVEPMSWMEPFLESGAIGGKIVCPNKKCNAKLGNFDWAGACCGCKEWVIPGFCLNRSKVDEIVR